MRPCPFGAGKTPSGLIHFLFPMRLHGWLGVGSCLFAKTPSASCPILPPIVSCVLPFPIDSSHAWSVSCHEFSPLRSGYTRRWRGAAAKHTVGQSYQLSSNNHQPPCIHPISALHMDSPRWPVTGSPTMHPWYVSNVSIIFDAPCLFLHHLLSVSLHFVAFLCIFQN
jgi:hypothetical protein